MSASSANEQVVVRFIADNASYLKGIADCQRTLVGFASKTDGTISKMEDTFAKMSKSFDNVTKSITTHARAIDQIEKAEIRLANQQAKNIGLETKLQMQREKNAQAANTTAAVVARAMASESASIAKVVASDNSRASVQDTNTAKFLISENSKGVALARTAAVENQTTAQFLMNENKKIIALAQLQAYTSTLNNTTLNGYQKVAAVQALMNTNYSKGTSAAQSFHTAGSQGAMSMFQHYTNLGAQLGFLVRQYLGLFAVFSSIKKVLTEGMGFNKFVEETTMAFSVMMKSVDEAKMRMEELYTFAVKSPLTFKETAEAARQLMAYGFQANELVGSMKMLGTVGKAVGASMQDMAYTYGTLRAQNHAYSRDLMQFSMRGIPIYEELAKVLDVNVGKIQKMTEEGKIGFKEVEQAFQNMTSSGGRFGGMLEAYMKTFAGKMSMLTDIAQKQAGVLTERMFNVLKDVVDSLIEVMETADFAKTMKELGQDIGLLVAGLVRFGEVVIKYYKPIALFVTLLLSLSIMKGIITMIGSIPAMLMKIAGGLSVLTGAQIVNTGTTVTLTAATNALNVALNGNVFIMMASVILGVASVAIPALIKAMDNVKQKNKEMVASFEEGALVQIPAVSKDYIKQLQDMVFKTPKNVGQLPIALSVISEIAKKYSVSEKIIINILALNKTITKEIADQLLLMDDFDKREKEQLARMTAPAGEAKNASETAIMALLSSMTNVDIYPYVEFIKDKTGKATIDYLTNTSGIIKAYIGNLADEISKDKRITEALGGVFTDEDQKKALETELKTLTELYVAMEAIGDFAGMRDIEARTKAINAWLLQFVGDADKLKESTKALEKLREEMIKMQEQVDMNTVLGFDPTEAEKLTYEWFRLDAKIKQGVGDFAFLSPEEVATYRILLSKIYDFNVKKIEDLKAKETEKAMASYQLEYDKLVLGEDQLAVFDAELQFKLDSLDASKAEYDMVAKIGALQRANLEKEIQLTKAKNFLNGESEQSKAFWDRVTVGLANTLGMKAYKDGTSYVPETGPAILHKGEAVIPAGMNRYADGTVNLKDLAMAGNYNELFKNVSVDTINPIINALFGAKKINLLGRAALMGFKKEDLYTMFKSLSDVQGLMPELFGDALHIKAKQNRTPINSSMLQELYSKFNPQKDSFVLRGIERMGENIPGFVEAIIALTDIMSPAVYRKLFGSKDVMIGSEIAQFAEYAKYASGTGGAKKGMALVGEKGPELVYMNGGETVIPNNMLNGYAKGTLKGTNSDTGDVLSFAEKFGQVLQFMNLEGSEVAKVLADQNVLWPVVGKAVVGSIQKVGLFSKVIDMATNPFSTLTDTVLEIGASLLDFSAVIESENAMLLAAIEKSMQKIQSDVDYYSNQLNEIIDKNIKTQQDLYELGLLTTTQYETNVAAQNAQRPLSGTVTPPALDPGALPGAIAGGQAAIDQKKKEADLLKTKTEFLGLLNDAPWWASTIKQGRSWVEKATDLDTLAGYAQKMSEGNIMYTGLLGINEGQVIGNQMKMFIESLATGTSFVPNDMTANIHQGEMVIPRKFSDSIRNGELSLGGNKGSGGATYNVSVSVYGSVTTERDLAVSISKEIRKQTVRGYA